MCKLFENIHQSFLFLYSSHRPNSGATSDTLLASMDRSRCYPAAVVPICNPERLGYLRGWSMKVMNSRLALA